jgi:hypothetical protein
VRLRSLVRPSFLIAAIVAAMLALTGSALAGPAPAAMAAQKVHLKGGNTALTLDKGTASVLTKNGVSVKPISHAKASGLTFTFPITGGSVDAKTLAGEIDHSGGIKFSAGHKSLSVQDFVIDTKTGVLTAKVTGTKTRVPLLKLDLSKASIDKGSNQIVVGNVKATLTSEAAAALNKTFGVKLFKQGLTIGVAKVTAKV